MGLIKDIFKGFVYIIKNLFRLIKFILSKLHQSYIFVKTFLIESRNETKDLNKLQLRMKERIKEFNDRVI